MSALFWLVTILFILAALYRVIVLRDYFSIYTYVLLGIYLPLLLYFCRWSSLITLEPQRGFYGLFIQFGLVLLVFLATDRSGQLRYRGLGVAKARHGLIIIITLIYLLSCLLENYLGSGSLLPSLAGIDIHTYRAPVLCYFTKAIFAICATNYLASRAAPRRVLRATHWILILSIFLLYVVGKSARLEVAIVAVQLGSLVLLLNLSAVRTSLASFRPRHIIGLAIALFAVSYAFVSVGNLRSTQFGTYEVTTYADSIGYNGPDFLRDQFAWYYGYFPMSFDNLNMSIAQAPSGLDLLGLTVYKAIYYGVLQFDNLLGLDPYYAESVGVWQVPQAMVATGFWNIYFDYRQLSLLVFVLVMLVYRYLRRRAQAYGATIADYVIYVYWVATWLFMSFQPFPLDVFVLTDIAIIYLLVHGLIVESVSNSLPAALGPKAQRYQQWK